MNLNRQSMNRSSTSLILQLSASNEATPISAEFVSWSDGPFAKIRAHIGETIVHKGARVRVPTVFEAKFSPADSEDGNRAFRTRNGALFIVKKAH